MVSNLVELSRRVSEAEGPIRELDLLVFKAFNAKYDSDDWVSYGGGLRHKMDSSDARCLPPPEATPSRYTASLDTVAALIAEKLPGFKWSLHKSGSPYIAGVMKDTPIRTMPHMGVAKTPALALLSAALLAIHESKGPSDE